MRKKQWLESTNPQAMLRHLGESVSDRKLRLFSCACCRRAWRFAKDKRLAPLLRLVEDVADGKKKSRDRERARERSYKITQARIDDSQQCIAWEMWGALRKEFDRTSCDLGESAAAAFGYEAGKGPEFYPAKAAEREQQPVLIREIFGNPFKPATFSAAWRTSTAMTLAKQMYEAREFSAAPILADALQDAGCDSDAILTHLRDTSATHYRGCWVIDLVLGKK
jgi:hypothetical protein